MPRQWQRLGVATLVALVGLGPAPARPEVPAGTRPGVAFRVAGEVVELTNVERRRGGRVPLRASARLMRAAQLHAEQMARTRRLAHVLPKAAYPRIEDRLAAARYAWRAYGENVAMGQSSAEDVVESWMRSRGHRKNILNPDFAEMGVGYAVDAAGRPYYVQVFAGPAS